MVDCVAYFGRSNRRGDDDSQDIVRIIKAQLSAGLLCLCLIRTQLAVAL